MQHRKLNRNLSIASRTFWHRPGVKLDRTVSTSMTTRGGWDGRMITPFRGCCVATGARRALYFGSFITLFLFLSSINFLHHVFKWILKHVASAQITTSWYDDVASRNPLSYLHPLVRVKDTYYAVSIIHSPPRRTVLVCICPPVEISNNTLVRARFSPARRRLLQRIRPVPAVSNWTSSHPRDKGVKKKKKASSIGAEILPDEFASTLRLYEYEHFDFN